MLQNSTPNRRFVRREHVGPIGRHIDPNPRSRSVIDGHRCERRFRGVIRSTSGLTALCAIFFNDLRTSEAQLRLQKPSKTVPRGVGDLHVDRWVVGTLAGTNPLCKVAERVARPNVCTRHEHTLDTRDFDHLERVGCVLDGDSAFGRQSEKAVVSIAILFSSPVSQFLYSCSLRIPPRNQASPI
jgi:hypothetical protein